MSALQFGLGLLGAFLATLAVALLAAVTEHYARKHDIWRELRRAARDEYRARTEPPSARVGSDEYVQNILRR